jgi:hypothetical protein
MNRKQPAYLLAAIAVAVAFLTSVTSARVALLHATERRQEQGSR